MLAVRSACGLTLPQRPHPRQATFLRMMDREVGYGGSVGGAKTSALMFAALQFACIPGYSALLMRRTHPQLTGDNQLMDRMEQWLAPTAARWVASEDYWEFPSGATVRFGHADRDEDKWKFGGVEVQYAGFDEVVNWPTEKVYEFVGFIRVRKPASREGLKPCPSCGMTLADVPLRTRSTANPGGPGHGWYRTRFGIQLPGGCPKGRRFVPSLLSDNPSLGEEYAETLEGLDVVTRERMLRGDWSITEAGRMFRREFFLQ